MKKNILGLAMMLCGLGMAGRSAAAENRDLSSIPLEMSACEQRFQQILNFDSRVSEKLTAFEGLRKDCSNFGRYYYLFGGLYLQSKNYEKSRDAYELGLKSTSNYDAQLKHGIATSYFEQKNFDKAAELAKRLTVEYPKYVGSYAILADISLGRRDFKQAVEYAERAVSITPFAGGYSVLTASYYELGNYQKALDSFRTGMKQENIQFIVRGDAIVAAAYAAAHLGLFPESARIVRIRLAALPESENSPAMQKLIGFLNQKGAW